MMKPTLTALAAAALLTAWPATAQAPAYADSLRLTLNYDGRLIVKVLDVRVEQTVRDGAYTSSARLVSSGILALFKRLDQRASVEGRLRDGRPEPAVFRHRNLGGRSVTASWTGSDVTTQAAPAYSSLGDPAATRAQRAEAVDPLTQVLRMALTPDGRNPCQAGTRRFFDGKQRYDLDFVFSGARTPDRRERRVGLTDTIGCTVRYREVAGFRRKPPEQRGQGLRGAVTVGFGRYGQGGPWVLSSLRAGTRLGDAVIELRSAEVAYR